MREILSGSLFTFVLFPIGSVILGIGVKFVSRNDKFSSFKKEDLAVGLDLWLTAILLLTVAISDRTIKLGKLASISSREAQEISAQLFDSLWYLVLLGVGLAAISTVVRKGGWQSADNMTGVIGITLPLLSGVMALIFVMAVAR